MSNNKRIIHNAKNLQGLEEREKRLIELEQEWKEKEEKLAKQQKQLEEKEKDLSRRIEEQAKEEAAYNERVQQFDKYEKLLKEKSKMAAREKELDRKDDKLNQLTEEHQKWMEETKASFEQRLYESDGKMFSELMNPFADTISSWLPSKAFRLIYKGSRDGMSAKIFHGLCDNQGPTLNIIQSTGGYLLGGYNPDNWDSPPSTFEGSKVLHNSSAFLFTLSNPHGIPPTKYLLKEGMVSTHQHSEFGIWFGGDKGSTGDITVDGHSKTFYCFFPRSFIDTTGKGKTTFDGAGIYFGNHNIDEILVFSVC